MLKYIFIFLSLIPISQQKDNSKVCIECIEKSVSEWVPYGFHDILSEPQFQCYGKPHSPYISWQCDCGNIYYQQDWCANYKLKTLYYAEQVCNCSAKRLKFKNALNTMLAQECECKGKRVVYTN